MKHVFGSVIGWGNTIFFTAVNFDLLWLMTGGKGCSEANTQTAPAADMAEESCASDTGLDSLLPAKGSFNS